MRACVCVCRQLPFFPIHIEGKAIMQPRKERKEDSFIDQLKSYEINLSLIRREFAPGFVNCKKGYTRLTAASNKAYQLFAHGRWFSRGTSVSSTTKTGRHDIAEILLKVAVLVIGLYELLDNPTT
jgi:hypothetical protein